MECPNCGRPIAEGERTCPGCGAQAFVPAPASGVPAGPPPLPAPVGRKTHVFPRSLVIAAGVVVLLVLLGCCCFAAYGYFAPVSGPPATQALPD